MHLKGCLGARHTWFKQAFSAIFISTFESNCPTVGIMGGILSWSVVLVSGLSARS